jgi:hypothetical protein
MNFINITFLYLSPYIYKENPKFLGGEEVFGYFTIRKERGEKGIRRRGKILFY